MNRIARALFTLAVVLTIGGATAQAGLLPVSVTVTPDAGQFRWTYAIVLPTDSQIRTGDYFTIYDFGGLVPGTNSQPVGWDYTMSKLGPTPAGVDPNDDPLIANLTWRYSGATLPTGQIGLGNFWAISAYGNQTESFFTASTHRTSDGRVDQNITETVVPVPTSTPPPGVPEPATLALAALGLPLVGLLRRMRK